MEAEVRNAFHDALEHMASIDLIELCNEAKVERCRATRDLSSCGRYVQHVLISCGHASLCAECSQRCDVCPICRISLPNGRNKQRLRLYYKCIEAGLISKRYDDRFQEKKDIVEHSMADIQRLYSLFDVALENNLVSLICHYVTDVCMNESAVSSDPVLSFLLDEVVVKDWCKRKFKNIILDLRGIYTLGAEEMKSKLCLLQKIVSQLAGISSILEVMVASFKENLSAQLHDLHHLWEDTMKVKQHLEVMTWCIQHQFLENVQSRYPIDKWKVAVRERKSAALKRSWPEFTSNSMDSGVQVLVLFIEQALSNLGIEQSFELETEDELDIFCLRCKDTPLLFRSKIDVDHVAKSITEGCYPFENVRTATDVLFLHGTSDMVVAKQAIFLYYLHDRHWTRPDAEWRYLVDDFAACFGITRDSILESLVFYLLDDTSDLALQEASHLLPEIAGSETHPKIAQVILERQCPDIALSVLRCTGHDGSSASINSEFDRMQSTSLGEAVTAVRVKIEGGLLTEAFMYQRMHCSKVKEENFKHATSEILTSDSWIYHVEILVSEICYLCIRRNLVDRLIELPWNYDEEKYLHKYLLDHACHAPSTTCGSLLVVFYLQRYRYTEAYRVNLKLQSLEESFMRTANEEVVSRMRMITQWRTGLVDKCLELLPEVQKQQVMTEEKADSGLFPSIDVHMLSKPDISNEPPNHKTSMKSSLILQTNLNSFLSRKAIGRTNLSSPTSNRPGDFNDAAPSILQWRLHSSVESPAAHRTNTFLSGISSPGTYNGDSVLAKDTFTRDSRRQDRQGYQSVGQTTPSRDVNLSTPKNPRNVNQLNSPRKPQNDHQFQGDVFSTGAELYGTINNADISRPYMPRANSEETNGMVNTVHINGTMIAPIHGRNPVDPQGHNMLDKSWTNIFSEESAMDFSWSSGKRDSPVEELDVRGALRWRSEESSGDEEDSGLPKHKGGVVPRRTKYPWR